MWRGVVLVLLCSLTFLTGLGRTAIQDSDEAYYAEAGREMVVSGDWITPHYNFEPRVNKPILLYWLIAATYLVAGVSEAAARFWPAISGLGVAVVAFLVGSRWVCRDVGLLAGVIVATSFGVVPFARQSLPDMPLAFFVSLSIWTVIESLGAPAASAEGASGRPRRRERWLYVAAVATALGMLTKGPVALALPVMVGLPLLAWEWWAGARPVRGSPVSVGQVALAAGLFILVATPWYVAITVAQGSEFLWQFFVGENVERFATSQYNTWRGHTYLLIIVAGLLPWSAFGLLWLRPAAALLSGRRQVSPIERRLLCWTVGPLLFFMVSIGSQPRYILPCLVPLAILLGRSVWTRASALTPKADWLLRLSTVAAGLFVAGAGLLILRAGPLLAAASPEWSAAGSIAIAAAGAVIAIGAVIGPRRWAPVIVAAGAAAALVVFEMSVLAPGRPEPVEVIATAARAHGVASPICACGALARSLPFYSHVKTFLAATNEGDADVVEFLTADRRLLAAIDAHVLARVEAMLGRTFPRLAEVRYLSAGVRQQPRTLLAPDPGLVQRIILISNR